MGETKGVRRGGGENDRGKEEGGKEGWERKKEERRRGREKRRGGGGSFGRNREDGIVWFPNPKRSSFQCSWNCAMAGWDAKSLLMRSLSLSLSSSSSTKASTAW